MNDPSFGREVLGDPERAGRLEWLVGNGIGGYASGTLTGQLSRRYHGLLIAALKAPVGRTLLLAKLAERIELDGAWYDLDDNRWASGVLSPQGSRHLESFRLENSVPVWTWALGDTRLEKRVWMEQGENTSYAQYRLAAARTPLTLALKCLVNHRDAHGTTAHGTWTPRVESATGGLRIEAFEGATPLWIIAPGAQVTLAQEWYRDFVLALEVERGLDAIEDHLFVGELRVRLEPGEIFTVVASTRHDVGRGGGAALALASALTRRRAYEKSLLDTWRKAQPAVARTAPAWIRQLVLAADTFIVERPTPADPNGRSVIAGYHWFSDWGRDTMIALPGLTLATGRPEIARSVLLNFARHADRGMLPNYFPEQGSPPEYNTADASLWLFQAVRAYVETTNDHEFLEEIYPVLEDIGAWVERGTRYGIGVDGQDGLLRAGEPRSAVTWMDAKVDNWVVTPRIGKPVELNALWFNALSAMATLAPRVKQPPENYAAMAARVERSFARFWNSETGCLYDVLDGPRGPEPAVRPNQILALSLPDSPLPSHQRHAVLEACGRWLLTSHGLRSLSPADPGYIGRYFGDRRARDGAYHQGTVWTWLLPHYALAHYRVNGDREAALALLAPLADLGMALGAGYLPEIADGDSPHAPRGCIAQAWSVAEALRAWHTLSALKQRSRTARRAPPAARTRSRAALRPADRE